MFFATGDFGLRAKGAAIFAIALSAWLLAACDKSNGSGTGGGATGSAPNVSKSRVGNGEEAGKEVKVASFREGKFKTPESATYVYRVTSVSGPSPSTRDTPLSVSEPRQVSDGVFEQETRRGPSNAAQKQIWVWRDEGVSLSTESWVFSGKESPPCLLNPPILVMKFPLQSKDSWEGQADCREQDGQSRRISATVLRVEKVRTADGYELEAFVIHETWHGTFSQSKGPTDATSESTYWYSPLLGIRIKEERKSSGSAGAVSMTTEEITSIPAEARNRVS